MGDRSPIASEEELIRRAVQGDAEAFGELYVRHLDRMYRYILFRVGNEMEAEDLTEQVFLRAWTAMEGYRDEGYPFSSWIYRIAHNLVVDYYRDDEEMAGPLESVSFVLPEEAPGPEELLIRKAEVVCLREAVARLPEQQQQLIVLRFVQGLSHAQVAEIMDKREIAVRVMQHRALATLNRFLEER